MVARGYEFYLLVLKVSLTRSLRSLERDTFCSAYALEDKIRISARPCTISSISYPVDSAIQGLNNRGLNFVVSSTLRHFTNSLLTLTC